MRSPAGIAIVNRSFWPQSQIIGEGLLRFAETQALSHPVTIITQTPSNLSEELRVAGRAQGVLLFAMHARTTSSSQLLWRILEALAFMCWVFCGLMRSKPAKVYVSTDPPVVVPFIVACYCRVWGAQYVYHLQDIHPEAANIVMPLNAWLFRMLRALDNFTLRHAERVITLSENMRRYLRARSLTDAPIDLLDNPAVAMPFSQCRDLDFVYCGNAGRLQRMPLLIEAIRQYALSGGRLRFSFAGGGVYSQDLQHLADTCENVRYFGVLPAHEAAALVGRHRWALLPIDDEVAEYAFPSKSSAYALSGTPILAICGADTSVARWVSEYEIGQVCAPYTDTLVACFFSLEMHLDGQYELSGTLVEKLQIDYFVRRLSALTLPLTNGVHNH